jgi:hypothetical protein
MSAGDVCNSTETWYVRKANERNNCRILYDVANEFNLDIPTNSDVHSYDHIATAAYTTETIHSDMFIQKNGMVTVLNKCVDTTTSNNGILYNMHASEGVWLFKGPLTTNSAMMHYGGSFGHERLQTSFPVAANIVRGSYSWRTTGSHHSLLCNRKVGFVHAKDSSSIARIDSHGLMSTSTPETQQYTCIDEAFLNSLEMSQWKRDNGITELIPIAVVHREFDHY